MITGFSKYAIQCHKDTNHLYDGYLPYEFHLRMVVANAYKFMHLVLEEDASIKTIVICACMGHDLIEDTRQNYSDIYETAGTIYFNNGGRFNEEPDKAIADIIYAVSNEKGKNRKGRENANYFEGIRDTPYATFVKLCDRIANIEYSKMTAWQSQAKLRMYEGEREHFKKELYADKYKEMFEYMESLFTAKHTQS